MQVVADTVVNGKVVVEGSALEEGALAAVPAREADGSFQLAAAEEYELVAAMAEIQRGEFVTLDPLLAALAR